MNPKMTMNADYTETFPATGEGLQAALAATERFGAARELSSSVISRARIIVEELFANTINHGHGGECERPVRLSLAVDPVFRLTFEDDAKHFDPTGWKPPGGVLPHERPEGQAGIAMIMGLSSEVRYFADPGGNRLAITIAV